MAVLAARRSVAASARAIWRKTWRGLATAGLEEETHNGEATPNQNLVAACLLERLPVVVPDDPAWETEYLEWQREILKPYTKELPKEFHETPAAADAGGGEWQPAPRVTEADRSNDIKSLQRKLDRRLFLVLKAKDAGDAAPWQLPSGPHTDGETMREAAERVLREAVEGAPTWKPFMIGHAPCAHWQSGAAGTTFVHKAQLIKGEIALAPGSQYADFAWLSREELLAGLGDDSLVSLFQKLLPKL